MAKPYIVRPELTEDDVISEIINGPVKISDLMRRSGKTRGELRGLVSKYAPKDKIKLPSRAKLNLLPVAPVRASLAEGGTTLAPPAVKPPAAAPAPPRPIPSGILQTLIGGGCALIGVALGLCNAIMNCQFGASFGHDWWSCLVLGGVGLAIDGGALLFLPAAGALAEQRRYVLCLAAFLSWLPFVALSTGAAIGFASSNIGDSLQARDSVIQHRRALDTELSRAQAERGKITEDRDPQIIEQQIQIEQGKVPLANWKSSNNCTSVTLSGPFCMALNQERAAKSSAEQRIKLDAKISELSTKIAELPPISAKDPAAEQIAQMAFGLVTTEQVRSYLVRCLAIIPGFASILLAIARALLRKSEERRG
jgi:hypothetical protein